MFAEGRQEERFQGDMRTFEVRGVYTVSVVVMIPHVCAYQTVHLNSRRTSVRASQVATVLKDNAGDIRDTGLIPELGRSPGEGNGNPLQYCCLGELMGRGAWWATVHGVTKRRTRLSD